MKPIYRLGSTPRKSFSRIQVGRFLRKWIAVKILRTLRWRPGLLGILQFFCRPRCEWLSLQFRSVLTYRNVPNWWGSPRQAQNCFARHLLLDAAKLFCLWTFKFLQTESWRELSLRQSLRSFLCFVRSSL